MKETTPMPCTSPLGHLSAYLSRQLRGASLGDALARRMCIVRGVV